MSRGPRAAVAVAVAAAVSVALLAAAAAARADETPAPPKRVYQTRVRGSREDRQPAETTVRTDEARHVAGTQGDALKVVENLPGVARASLGAGQLIVWGSAPEDTRVLVDGVEVPALYHLGGLRSAVNAELVRSLSFSPGGFGAAYGRGLGGLLRVETRALPPEGVHGEAAADVLDASAMVTAAIGRRLRIGVAGRYSYLDRILGGLVSPDAGDYFPIPRYDDYQLKATLALRPDEELSLVFLAADDHLRRSVALADPAHARTDSVDASSYRAILRYTRVLDGARVEVAPFFGYDERLASSRFGAVPSRLDVASFRYGARAEYRRLVARWLTVGLGADLLGTRSTVLRFGSLATPPREGDVYVFGQPPGGDAAAERFHVQLLDAAPWASAEFRAGPVTIAPGVRIDAWLIEGDQARPPSGDTPIAGFRRLQWSIDPRVHVAWRAHRRVTVEAAAGLYHQAPEPQDLGAAFGNPTLGIERALHVTAGAEVRVTDTLAIEALGFYKQLDDLISRSPLASPPVAAALQQDGAGRAFGGQLLLRQEPWHGLSGWIGYTLGRAERRDHPGQPFRLFDYDQTHVLAAVASYRYRGWSFGARFRFSTGFPRTPVVGSFYDVRGDQFQPLFGAHNSIRIPSFIQLDLRVDRAFVWRRVALELYLDVENVTYQRNPEEIVYSEDFSRRGYITGLPTLAVLGARVQF